MRALTAEEMDIVAGGDGTTITVTGSRSETDYFFLMRSLDGGGGSYGGGGGGGGGGGSTGPYATAGASAAANAFADQHVHNNGTTAKDRAEYQKAHDDVAKLYDWAQAHPNDSIDIGNGQTITGAQLMADLTAITINIVDVGGGATGAQTAYSGSTGLATITINPNTSNVTAYNQTSSGQDFVVLHEVGHAVYDVSYGGLTGATAENQANTAADSLAGAIGASPYPH